MPDAAPPHAGPEDATPEDGVPAGASTGSSSSAEPHARPAQPALVEALGGKRGLVDSGLPAVVFVLVNSLAQILTSREEALRAALVAAVLTGVGIVVLRIARKETLQQAISGFLGLALAVWFAARSGEARGFFLPGILINIAYGTAFLLSAVVGWPLVGAIYNAVEGLGARWREDPRLRRAFAFASVGWALVFGARAAVQGTLYLMDRPGLLAAARLSMGWPLTIGAVALTMAYIKRARAKTDQGPAASA